LSCPGQRTIVLKFVYFNQPVTSTDRRDKDDEDEKREPVFTRFFPKLNV
jgi:hypothetical protein